MRVGTTHDATLLHAYRARDPEGSDVEVVVVHVPNHALGAFIDALEAVGTLRLSVIPQGVITLQPPAFRVSRQLQDVSQRSPLEIFLAGLQSVGSWRGFLGYATAAGAIVWLGLLTNSVFLLVAAMLIAPFAGPAMNAAIATARGDGTLLARALLRYVASLLTTTGVAGVLSFIVRQDVITAQMSATANISTATVVLPLAAGAAGALHLVQGERSNLVSGASIGMLVAASLAPPAGLLGMALALADWQLLPSALFLLALQLAGINIAGAIIFRLAGLAPRGVRYDRGRPLVAWLSVIVSIGGLAALLGWQFLSPSPTLQRSTLQQHARDVVHQAVEEVPAAYLAGVEADFTRPDIPGQHTLLLRIHAQRRRGAEESDAVLRQEITDRVQQAILRRWSGITPLVDVTVLDPP